LRLVKLREGEQWYLRYGPFMLVDAATNSVVAFGLNRDEVEAELRPS
jgi:hypothetical protein